MFIPTPADLKQHEKCNALRPNTNVSRKTLFVYNIIMVTFVYKLLDFSSVCFYRMTAVVFFKSDCIPRKLKEYMHPNVNSIKRRNFI